VNTSSYRGRLLWLSLASTLLVSIWTAPAAAHKIRIFATAEGSTISGYAYFTGGGRLKQATVQVFAPGGQRLDEILTDEKGEFTFEAKHPCDHLLTVETADGHVAEWTVGAKELPDRLPPLAGPTSRTSTELITEAKEALAENLAEGRCKTDSVTAADIERAVAKAVSEEIAPLRKQINLYREQIEQYEEKIRLRDILGGVGYLLGLAGLAFYFLGLRRTEKS